MNQALNRKPKRRVWLKTLFGLLVIGGIGFLFYQWQQYQHERELRLLLGQIDADDPGWRWEEINANLSAIPDDKNAAKRLIAISELFGMNRLKGRNQWFNAYLAIESKYHSSFEYVERHPAHRIPENLIAPMRAHLKSAPGPEGLQQLRQLRHLHIGKWSASGDPLLCNRRYEDWYLPFDVNRLLFWNTEIQLDAEKPEIALENVSTVLAMTRWFNHDPLPRMFLVYNTIRTHGYADNGLQRILGQSSNLTEIQLLNLQNEFLRTEREMVSLEKLYRNVRAGIDHDLQLLQEGKVELSKELQKMNIFVLSTSSPGLDAFLTRCVPTLMIAPWCRPLPWALERAEALKYCNETIAWSHLPDHELLPRWRNWPEPVTRCPPFTACICLDANQKYYNEKVDHQSRMYLARLFLNEKAANRVCAAALASERYRLIYGRWPISWEQLIPQFLPEALNDPYTGKPLKLKLVEDGLIVYSVGFNEKDDGGAVLPGDDRKVLDLGVRLWNPDQRRRPARKLDDQ